MGKVLIKCVQTPMQKYFYDRSLDSVVMVDDEEYQILKTVEKTKQVPDGSLGRFVNNGLLRETAIRLIIRLNSCFTKNSITSSVIKVPLVVIVKRIFLSPLCCKT